METHKNGWWKPVVITVGVLVIGAAITYGITQGTNTETNERQDTAIRENKEEIRYVRDDVVEIKIEQKVTNRFLEKMDEENMKEAREEINEENGGNDVQTRTDN